MSDQPQRFELMVCAFERNPRHCVYLNDYRIAGGKPWGGATAQTTWSVTMADLENAVPEIRAMREALQYGLDLYGPNAPDGRWPIEKRREFDRLARAALQTAVAPEVASEVRASGQAPGGPNDPFGGL